MLQKSQSVIRMSLPVCGLCSTRPQSLPATVTLLSAPQQSRKSSGRCLVMVLPWRLASQTPCIKNRLLYVHRLQNGEGRQWSLEFLWVWGLWGGEGFIKSERGRNGKRERLAEFSVWFGIYMRRTDRKESWWNDIVFCFIYYSVLRAGPRAVWLDWVLKVI